MNNEIKEILDKLQKVANKETASRNALMEMKDTDYQLLLDYITNLEQKYQDAINQSIEDHKYASKKEDETLDYKSRNEKAVELIKEAGCYDEKTKTFCDDIWEELPKILNILNGKE